MPRFPHVLLLSWCLVVAPGKMLRGQESSGTSAGSPTPAPSVAETAPKPPAPALKSIAPPKTEEEIRIETLEKLADQLSHRMRSLKERESALTAREDAICGARKGRPEARGDDQLDGGADAPAGGGGEAPREAAAAPDLEWGPPPPAVYGQYAAVLDGQTMQFYHKKQAETKVPVASTQKIVTALVICQDGNLDGFAEIPKEVLNVEPTVVGVKPGESTRADSSSPPSL